MMHELAVLPRFEIRPLSEEEGGGYLIEFRDFPGCVADGETPEAAMQEGLDALAAYVRTLEDLGCLPDAGVRAVGERVARQVAALSPISERDAVDWIESVSAFDEA